MNYKVLLCGGDRHYVTFEFRICDDNKATQIFFTALSCDLDDRGKKHELAKFRRNSGNL